jgi:hypothetical protein
MGQENEADLPVDGPVIDEETGARSYVVHGPDRDIGFAVVPEGQGWGVEIEGIPGPGIVHEEPWGEPEAARDAALKAVRSMLALEKMQREEMERSKG